MAVKPKRCNDYSAAPHVCWYRATVVVRCGGVVVFLLCIQRSCGMVWRGRGCDARQCDVRLRSHAVSSDEAGKCEKL